MKQDDFILYIAIGFAAFFVGLAVGIILTSFLHGRQAERGYVVIGDKVWVTQEFKPKETKHD